MNEKIEEHVQTLQPFTKLCMTIGELPTSYLMSMTYYEQLIWFTKFLQEQVIPAVNQNAAVTKELQDLFVELQSYVNNYFDNLDVQEEINNKLDAMVEAGTLQEIIADYLNSKAIFGFDNVSSMKNSTNLINGSYARTLGYYSKNDGGSALYKIREITNDDVVDEMLIIEMLNDETLVAELIIENDTLNLKQIGLKSNDNTFDNSIKLNSILNNTNVTNYKFFIPDGIYYLLNGVTITRKADGMIFEGNGHLSDDGLNTGSKFIYTGSDYALTFSQRLWRATIENFDIESPNGSGIHFVGNVHDSKINNLDLKVKTIGIKDEKSGYSYWNNIHISDNESSTEYIGFDLTSNELIEYLYFNECIVDSYYGTYTNTYSYGIKSNHLNHFYMENCDFVNLSYGFYLDAMTNSKYLNLTTSNFTCNVADLYLNSNGTSISGVYITECSFSIRASNSHVLVTERVSPRSTRGIIFENNHISDMLSGITTDYLISIGSNSIVTGTCVFNNNGYNTNTTTPFINIPNMYKLASPLSHSFVKSKIIGLEGDGTTTSYKVVLSDISPFTEKPALVISDTKGLISSYTIDNTHDGELSTTITFSEAYTGRDYISIHVIGDFIHDMKTIGS